MATPKPDPLAEIRARLDNIEALLDKFAERNADLLRPRPKQRRYDRKIPKTVEADGNRHIGRPLPQTATDHVAREENPTTRIRAGE